MSAMAHNEDSQAERHGARGPSRVTNNGIERAFHTTRHTRPAKALGRSRSARAPSPTSAPTCGSTPRDDSSTNNGIEKAHRTLRVARPCPLSPQQTPPPAGGASDNASTTNNGVEKAYRTTRRALASKSLPLFRGSFQPPPLGEVVVSYGGGVNSVALLILLHRLRIVPRAIVMADPGAERRATIRFRDEVLPPWLDRVGFPRVVVITRAAEGAYRERAWRLETLLEECLRTKSLPSVAYGWKKCSQKYKGEPQRWWIARQAWAVAEWEAGRRLVKAIGYDVDEGRRVRRAFATPWEEARFVAWYGLHDAGLTREDCEDLIRDEGLELPPKSACVWCPNNTLAEWGFARREEPEAFADAVRMSRNAAAQIEQPDVVGLMRCNPHGKRQLHVWAEGGYADGAAGTLPAAIEALQANGLDVIDVERIAAEERDAMPCECAL